MDEYLENRIGTHLDDAGFAHGGCAQKNDLDPVDGVWADLDGASLRRADVSRLSIAGIVSPFQKIQVQLCNKKRLRSAKLGPQIYTVNVGLSPLKTLMH